MPTTALSLHCLCCTLAVEILCYNHSTVHGVLGIRLSLSTQNATSNPPVFLYVPPMIWENSLVDQKLIYLGSSLLLPFHMTALAHIHLKGKITILLYYFISLFGHNIWWENRWNGSLWPKNGPKLTNQYIFKAQNQAVGQVKE